MDNFRVIYRILRYLEKALDYDEPDELHICKNNGHLRTEVAFIVGDARRRKLHRSGVYEGERWSQNSHVCFQCTTHP